MTISQPVGDLYAELGVGEQATRDQIVAAFRARAKALHPDMNPGDAEAAEQFKTLGRAYQVLADPDARARYDAGRLVASAGIPGVAARVAPVPVVARFQLTRKAARWLVGGGIAMIVLGLLSAFWVVSLQREDADLRARGVAATAVVVKFQGERYLAFSLPNGKVVRAQESQKTGEVAPVLGTRVGIHYDRSDPTTIVTDQSHTGRDVTLWIVAVKFVVGGALLIWFGRRRLRRAD
ncbi:MAG: J domain-containing protein [Acidimicrobiia bacterium]